MKYSIDQALAPYFYKQVAEGSQSLSLAFSLWYFQFKNNYKKLQGLGWRKRT